MNICLRVHFATSKAYVSDFPCSPNAVYKRSTRKVALVARYLRMSYIHTSSGPFKLNFFSSLIIIFSRVFLWRWAYVILRKHAALAVSNSTFICLQLSIFSFITKCGVCRLLWSTVATFSLRLMHPQISGFLKNFEIVLRFRASSIPSIFPHFSRGSSSHVAFSSRNKPMNTTLLVYLRRDIFL